MRAARVGAVGDDTMIIQMRGGEPDYTDVGAVGGSPIIQMRGGEPDYTDAGW